MRLTRYFMYRRLGELFQKKISGKILSISELGDMSFLVDLSKSDVIEAYYPEFDMQKLPFDKEVFDYVISDQVIEHIENPFSAIAESYRVLKKRRHCYTYHLLYKLFSSVS